jgi:hypothetical protein
MKAKPLLCTLLLLLTLAAGARAEDIDVTRLPGYIDLEDIRIPADASAVRDIDLGPSLLQMAAEAEAGPSSSLSRVLDRLHLIRVVSFAYDGNDEEIREHVERIGRQLEDEDWDRLIRVRDEDQLMTLSIKYDQKRIAGLMFVGYAPEDEVTFVNIVGSMDLASLASLAAELSGVELEGFFDELEDY